MPVRPEMIILNKDTTPVWVAYAYLTAQRILFYDNKDWLEMWQQWAGFNGYTYIPPQSPMLPQAVVFIGDNAATVIFDGTRYYSQYAAEILGFRATQPALGEPYYHRWFLWTYNQLKTTLAGIYNGVPGNIPWVTVGHSLGGALAIIAARDILVNFRRPVPGVMLFGNPRVQANSRNWYVPAGYMRYVVDIDPVPLLPPAWSGFLSSIPGAVINDSFVGAYTHEDQAFVLYESGAMSRGDVETFLLANALKAIADSVRTFSVQVGFEYTHQAGNYSRRLLREMQRQNSFPSDFAVLAQLNQFLDAYDVGMLPVNANGVKLPSISAFFDPLSNAVDANPADTIPPHDLGQYVESVFLDHNLFFFGGHNTMAKQFQGHDRRMIETLFTLTQNIIDRDTRAGDPKPTRALSTRLLMFPAGGSPDLKAALVLIHSRATALLGMMK